MSDRSPTELHPHELAWRMDQEHITLNMGERQQAADLLRDRHDDNGEPKLMVKIVAAAILDDRGMVHSMPQPARHHDIIRGLRAIGYEGPVQGDHQGFLLSNGVFARRAGARTVARRAGQIIGGKLRGSVLTSEDLW